MVWAWCLLLYTQIALCIKSSSSLPNLCKYIALSNILILCWISYKVCKVWVGLKLPQKVWELGRLKIPQRVRISRCHIVRPLWSLWGAPLQDTEMRGYTSLILHGLPFIRLRREKLWNRVGTRPDLVESNRYFKSKYYSKDRIWWQTRRLRYLQTALPTGQLEMSHTCVM